MKWSSECFCSRVHCVAATQSLRKTGSSNPQWNAELDSVQPGWLMHQVPNTMQLLWWGDVLCARHFTAAFLSPLCLAGASLFREGKTHPECFRALKSYLLLLLLLLLVPSQDTALHLKRYWNPSVPACHSQRLIWPLCFALFAVKPNQLLRLKAAGQAISSSFCLVWMGLRGEAQQLRFWVSFSFRNMKLQDVTVLSFYGSPVCQFTHQTDSQWKCYPKYPVNWRELMYKP